MKSLFLIFIILFNIVDLIKADPQVKQETKDNTIKIGIEYRSRIELIGELDKKRKTQMYSDEQYFKEKESLPEGGCLFITLIGKTIGSTDPSNFLFFAEKNGDTLIFEKGTQKVSNYFVIGSGSYFSPSTIWHNGDIFCISKPIEEGESFHLHIIDQIFNERNDFTITANAMEKIKKYGYSFERIHKAQNALVYFIIGIGTICLIGLLALGPSK